MLLKAGQRLLFILMFVGAVLSALGLLNTPFDNLWLLLAALGIAVAVVRTWANKTALGPAVLKTFFLSGLLCLCLIAMNNALKNPARSCQYQSPNAEHTVILRYDPVSRPRLYRKHNLLFRSELALDAIPGYTETVTFAVIWRSESRLKLDLGLYKGAYEKYEIDLSTGESRYYRILPDDLNDFCDW